MIVTEKFRFVAIVILFFFHAFTLSSYADEDIANANSPSNISQDKFVSGALIGSTIGLGIGHVLQDRYQRDKGNGWIFTLGELGPFGVVIVGSLAEWMVNQCGGDAGSHDECKAKERRIFGTSDAWNTATAVALGFKIWEIIDVWSYPHDRVTEVKNNNANTAKRLFILPAGNKEILIGAKLTF